MCPRAAPPCFARQGALAPAVLSGPRLRVQLALFEERGPADEELPALAARTVPLPAVDARVLAGGEPVADLGQQIGNLALL